MKAPSYKQIQLKTNPEIWNDFSEKVSTLQILAEIKVSQISNIPDSLRTKLLAFTNIASKIDVQIRDIYENNLTNYATFKSEAKALLQDTNYKHCFRSCSNAEIMAKKQLCEFSGMFDEWAILEKEYRKLCKEYECPASVAKQYRKLDAFFTNDRSNETAEVAFDWYNESIATRQEFNYNLTLKINDYGRMIKLHVQNTKKCGRYDKFALEEYNNIVQRKQIKMDSDMERTL